MTAYAIAQMVAVLDADTKGLDSRLAKVEEQLKATQEAADRMSDMMQASFVKAAEGPKLVIASLEQLEKGEANLADYQFRIGQKSVVDYKRFLSERMAANNTWETEWRSSAMRMAAIDKQIQEESVSNMKKQMQIGSNLQKVEALYGTGYNVNKVSRDYEYNQAVKIVSNPNADVDAQLKASEKIVAITKEEEIERTKATIEGVQQREVAISNLARFEYEQGTLSEEAYKVFLQRRMADYDEYTAQWKTASFQLIALDNEANAQMERSAKELNAKLLADKKAELAQEAEIFKTERQMQMEEDRRFLAFMDSENAKYQETQATRSARNKNNFATSMGLGGNIAAGVTAVEAASALMYSNFEKKTTSVANNSIMTTQQLEDMRKVVLQLGKDTGSKFDDLADGFMRITSEGYKGAEAVNILNVANKEAVATTSEVKDTANDLATTMRVFNIDGSKAGRTMDILDQAAAKGNATMAEWVRNTGEANAMAGSYSGSLTDVNAALSALTRHGLSVSQADTQIRNLINHIVNPQPEVKKVLAALQEPVKAKYGVDLEFDFSQKGYQAKGLYGILADLAKVTGGNAEVMNGKFIPAMRGGLAAMVLTTKGAKDFHDILQVLNAEQSGTGQSPHELGFKRMMDTTAQQWEKFARTIETDFMPVGEKAMKIFIDWKPGIEKLLDLVLALTEAFQKLPQPIQDVIAVIGGLVILNKFTGILTALQIPAAFSSGLRVVGDLLPKLVVGGKGLATSFSLAAGETTGFGTALSGFAATGGPIAIAVAALIGLGIELFHLKERFDEMREAQDNAAKSASSYADAQANTIKVRGIEGHNEVNRQKQAQELSDAKDSLADNEKQLALMDSLKKKGLPDSGNRVEILNNIATAKSNIDSLTKAIEFSTKALQDYAAVHGHFGTFGGSSKTTISEGNKLGTMFGFTDIGGKASSGHVTDSDHYTGNALDFMTHGDKTKGQELADFAAAHMADEHIKYVIWQQSIISLARIKEGWRKMPDRGSATANHMDHIHISFSPENAGDLPGIGSGNNGLTSKDVAAYIAAEKATEAARKAAERAAKEAAAHYDHEIRALDLIIILKKKKEDLDTNEAIQKAKFDLSAQGSLHLITDPTKRNALMQKAAAADAAEHQKYIQDIIDSGNDKLNLQQLPYEKQQAISEFTGGSLDKWKALGDGTSKIQTQILAAVHAGNVQKEIYEEKKALDDLALSLASVGNAAKQAAIEKVAGSDAKKWKELTASQQEEAIGFERNLLIGKDLLQLQNEYADKAAASLPPVKTASEAAERAIDSLVRKLGIAVKDPKWQQFLGSIRSNAKLDDKNTNDNWLTAQQDQFYLNEKEKTDSQKGFNADGTPKPIDVGQKAVDEWLKSNREAIDKYKAYYKDAAQSNLEQFEDVIRQEALDLDEFTQKQALHKTIIEGAKNVDDLKYSMVGAYTEAEKAVHLWEESNKQAISQLRKDMGSAADSIILNYKNIIAEQANATAKINVYNKAGGSLEEAMKQANELRSSDPFQQWLNSFMELQKQTDSKGNTTYALGLPTGTDVDTLKQVYDQIHKIQLMNQAADMEKQAIAGFTQGVMNGLNSAFSPSAQDRGNAQSQLLSLKDKQLQYQVAQAEFHSKYPNDPNDPYVQRLKDIQTQIDQTNTKIHGMGNNLDSVFKRVFSGIYGEFQQTLVKMAQSYLQSQLLQYLNRQWGLPGLGGSSSNQGSSGLSAVISGISGILNFLPGGGGGGSGGTWSQNTVPLPGGGTAFAAAYGGREQVGVPTKVGDAGEPEWIIPDAPGYIVPQSKLRGLMGSQPTDNRPVQENNVTHNTVNIKQIITTPDVNSFRQSRASQRQDAIKLLRGIRG